MVGRFRTELKNALCSLEKRKMWDLRPSEHQLGALSLSVFIAHMYRHTCSMEALEWKCLYTTGIRCLYFMG